MSYLKKLHKIQYLQEELYKVRYLQELLHEISQGRTALYNSLLITAEYVGW